MGELFIVHDIIIIFMIISSYIIVLWLGEGNFSHVGPLPSITHLIWVLCHVYIEREGFTSPLGALITSHMSYILSGDDGGMDRLV